MPTMRLAYLQTNPRFLAVEQNNADALRRLEKTTADLVVLPEFFSTGYNFRSRKDVARVAEPVTGPTVRALEEAARRQKRAIAAGFAEREGSRFYNSAVLVTPRKTFLYRKIHLFGREKLFFTPGNLGFRVFDIGAARVGLMICFDWFFPEACRALAVKGAQVIAHPANLVLPWCPEAMKTRCLENRVFAVTANRVGGERGLRFIGQSQIVSPGGQVLSRAPGRASASGVARVDPRHAVRKSLNRFNDLLSDRRPRFYA